MNALNELKAKYPKAPAWSIGDSVELANALAALVVKGKKTASCGSLAAYQSEDNPPQVGSYHIILNGHQEPVCVIRITSLRLVKFCDVDEAFARKEGEGDLSLEYWRKEHRRFFTQAGRFSEEMELIAEEFEVVELV